MMFMTHALAAFLLTFSSVDSKKFSGKDIDAAYKAGKFDKKTLMNGAIPYKEYLRRTQEEEEKNYANYGYYGNYENIQDMGNYYMQQQNQLEEEYGNFQYFDQYYEEMEATPQYRIQFHTCVTLEVQNFNLFMTNLVNYTRDGILKSIRSYVLFDLCTSRQGCQNQTASSNDIYMVDLTTYIEAVVAYGPDHQEMVCDACQNWGYSVCGFEESYEYQYQQDGGDDAEANNNKRRKMADYYMVFDESNCNECEQYQCFYDSEGDAEKDFEAIEEWIAEIADCQETEGFWNNLALYAGWMCNSDGSGIEIGLFIDQYCRLYNNALSYTDYMGEDDYQYFYQSQAVFPYMFTGIIECADMDDVAYLDQEDYEAWKDQMYEEMFEEVQYMDEDQWEDYWEEYQKQKGDEDNQGINGGCQAIFQGEFAVRSIGNCGYYNNNNNNEQNNEDGTVYKQIQTQYQTIITNYSTSSKGWYKYDLSAHGVLSGQATCNSVASKVLNSGGSIKYNGYSGYSNGNDTKTGNSYFDQSGSDSSGSSDSSGNRGFWKYSKDGSSTDKPWQESLFSRNGKSTLQTPSAKLSPLEIAWIVLATIIVTGIFLHFTRKVVVKRIAKKKRKAAEERLETEYIKTDPTGNPLIVA